MNLRVTAADVDAAAARIRSAIVETPCSASRTLSQITGAEVVLKFENLQYTASFKERGARNFLLGLDEEARAKGVVAASAGNHAQGVAHHARLLGIDATIVMPRVTPFTKVTRTETLGAHVVLHGESLTEATTEAAAIAVRTGATPVPAFDDPAVIAGQGTVALEMLAARPDLEVLIVPVGGGGLISGMAVASKAARPDVEIIGVQSERYASMAGALGQTVEPPGGTTIAEGIAVTEPGRITTEIVAELVDAMLVVREESIEEAVSLYLEIEKTVVEGAGAASLAAVLEHRERFAGRRVGLVVSGGNIDLRVLSSVILRALARSGRLVRLRLEIMDRPGMLASVATIIGNAGGNIIDVSHHRDLPGVPLKDAVLEVSLETRDRAHADAIVASLRERKFVVTVA
ncbi:MAG: threonine dehydratase [Actinomycetota bacterium]|nr:threonine dehydratase [Actinomycetota bacterium]